MELAKARPHHHPFHFVRTFTFITCQVTAPFHFGETLKEQWAHSTQCGHDLFYTVLINCNSFFHNKRCTRSNYSIKRIFCRGRPAACYQLKQKEVCRTLWEMPELLSKISNFHVNRTAAKLHMHTVTKSCYTPKPSCHMRCSRTSFSSLPNVGRNHNVISDMWLLWHIACYQARGVQ